MTILVSPDGKKFDVPDENVGKASELYGLVPQQQFERDAAYEAEPFADKAKESIKVGFSSALRTIDRGVGALGGDTIQNPSDEMEAENPGLSGLQSTLYSPQAQIEAGRHGIASAVGQAAAVAPALAIGGAPGVVLDAALGGYGAEAENAWKENRDFSQEAAFQNVAAGLLVGGGIAAVGKVGGMLSRTGRNLLVEGEHASAAREARDLLDSEAKSTAESGAKDLSADDIAARGADDHGVAYLRDNAPAITDEIATKQAKAAQELLDTYGELGKLKPSKEELAAQIPENPIDQSRWVVHARQAAYDALEAVPDNIASPLRKQLSELGEGKDAATWFQQASDISDDLARARFDIVKRAPREVIELAEQEAAAAPKTSASPVEAAPEGATGEAGVPQPEAEAPPQSPADIQVAQVRAIDNAARVISDGLKQESLWGAAANDEAARASNYARRVGDHIDAFESQFTTKVGKARKADPAKFRSFLQADDVSGALRSRTLQATIDAAQATADAAQRFGRHDEAQRILGAIDTLQRTQRQAQAVAAAVKAVPREAIDTAVRTPAQQALDYIAGKVQAHAGKVVGGAVGHAVGGPLGMMAGAGAGQAAQSAIQGIAARAGVFKAVQGFAKASARSNRAGVNALLAPVLGTVTTGAIRAGSAVAAGAGKAFALTAPAAAQITAANFDATRDHIEKMATDPRYFGEVMGASFGSMPDHAPEVFSGLSQQTGKAVQYLASVAPGGTSGGPFSRRYGVGEDELWEFNQKFSAIADPEFIQTQLNRGTLTSQAMEAFQFMHPTQYSRLQYDVFERLHVLKREGIPVHTQAREQLDVLLDLDGGGEPGLTWAVAERAEAARNSHYAPLQAHQAKSAQPSDVGSDMQSSALATLGNGAAAGKD